MTIFLNDISHYQGTSFPINGPLMAKATEGVSFVDSAYAHNKKTTLAGGWPFAGYHFLDPGNAAAQASHAFSVIGKTPAMLDVERSSGGNASWADAKAFITAYRKLGGVLHLAYIPEWYWSGTWHSPDLTWLTDNNIGMISSHYVHTYSDTGPGWDSYGGVKPIIWQFTDGDTSRGFSYGLHGVDTNAFKGTQDQLGSLFLHGPNYTEDEMTPADWTKLQGLLDAQKTDILNAVGIKVWSYDPNTTDSAAYGTNVPYFQADAKTNPTAAPRWFPTQILLALKKIGDKIGVDIANIKNEP